MVFLMLRTVFYSHPHKTFQSKIFGTPSPLGPVST